ncbi:hypothetical protein PSN45_003459 [Yamadazyma tenuis]|uniref:MFS general substrate transporter n=1 Tax=Candida tenuis (strain ATCC 10573 / BCRC 21748 / CBS 615 / JCM 9827 / NBRC 10315 / NRRL Y-1498 / VKM Y-70) TaxID=590646 RepID=G3AY23_CANTC|nr:MFS general substrate transporter [Yamadazyma tenuis ATCC 10573]EGV65753.1 MFS general substrate transporter [Yamadazyma tenuis ATCC 10573]WEJ95928.1 hypothetical protein PSN45_003459 [Yamadazyma tenuis]
MTLGIKEPKRKNVTGTIVMLQDPEDGSGNDLAVLKKNKEGTILHPQPHDTPNDPLNWPVWRRDLCLMIVGFQTFLGGGQSPLLAAGMTSLTIEFDKTSTMISYLVGIFMLSLGLGSVFASPSAVLYGKRVVYLSGILLFLVGAIVGGSSQSYAVLMIGRIITGFGASPTESLPSATIAEIYFAHERAYRVGIYTMLMLGGKNIVPLLSSLVFQYLDRHWLFWILAMLLGANLVLTFLFVPETFWEREPTPNKRSIKETGAARTAKNFKPPNERPNAFALNSANQSQRTIPTVHNMPPDLSILETIEEEEPRTFASRLSVFSGRHTIDSWWMVALRPFVLYTYPSVLFGSLVYSFAVVWLIVISEVISEIFRSEPYGYSQQTVGLFYISPFIGGILGSMTTGLVSDRLSRYLISRNKGVYEPEFRLVMMIPATFFIAFGFLGYGWSIQVHDPWVAPVIFFGCLSFGSSMASTTAITFTVDSYKMFASEGLVSLNFAKNFIGFAFSLFNNSFMQARGARITFATYAIIQIVVSVFGIPLYIYGKKCRAWTDEKELLRFLYNPDNLQKDVSVSQEDTKENLDNVSQSTNSKEYDTSASA